MMTVVRPPPEGQGSDPPTSSRRKPCITLTPTEQARVRATIRNLKILYGSFKCLAEVMGVSHWTLYGIVNGKNSASLVTARRAAKAAGTTVEQLLGGLALADRCPTCGALRGGST